MESFCFLFPTHFRVGGVFQDSDTFVNKEKKNWGSREPMGGEVTPAIRRHSLTPTILCACSELVPQTHLWHLDCLFLIYICICLSPPPAPHPAPPATSQQCTLPGSDTHNRPWPGPSPILGQTQTGVSPHEGTWGTRGMTPTARPQPPKPTLLLPATLETQRKGSRENRI